MHTSTAVAVVLAVILVASQDALGYDTRSAPRKYSIGEEVNVSVYRLVSGHTMTTYDYYDPALPFCRPPAVAQFPTSPSSIVGSDHTSASLYRINFLAPVSCAVLKGCEQPFPDAPLLYRLVELEYRAQILVDGLPVTWAHADPRTGAKLRSGLGVPLGARGLDGALYLYNHLEFKVHYQDYEGNRYFITRVEVEPLSTASAECRIWRPLVVAGEGGAVSKAPVWTYSVRWVPEKVPVTPGAYSTRWEKFARESPKADPDFPLFAGINATAATIFLAVVVIILATCTAPRCASASAVTLSRGHGEKPETPPSLALQPAPGRPLLFSVLVGVGSQLLVAFAAVLAAICADRVQASDAYSVLSAVCVALPLAGCVAGYVSGRLYALFHGKRKWLCAFAAAAATPAAFHLLVFALVSTTIGTSAFDFAVLWRASAIMILSAPISVLGSAVSAHAERRRRRSKSGGGRRSTRHALPGPSAPTPSPSPGSSCAKPPPPPWKVRQEWYAIPWICIAFGAFVPFAGGCVQLLTVVTSVWSYGVVSLSGTCVWLAVAVYIVCPLTSVITVSFGVLGKSPFWWWRSFLVGAASAAYFVPYFWVYYLSGLDFVDASSAITYALYCVVATAAYSIATGAAGTLASLFIAPKILRVKN